MAVAIRVKRVTYLDKEAMRTFSVWHPQVKVNREWCYLPDESSRTKLQEADGKLTATEFAVIAGRKIEEDEENGVKYEDDAIK